MMAQGNPDAAKILLDQYRLTEEDCSKVVSDSHLNLLAQSCCAGGAWKTLAPHLELERAVVEDIDRKQVEDSEKRSTFFYQWKQTKGSGATYIKLVKALLLNQRKLDAEKLLILVPTALASSSSFFSSTNRSCSDPSSLPTDLRKDLKQQLRFSLNDIKTKYGLFVECVRTGMKERGISATELSSFLLSQSVFDYDEQDYKLFSDDIAALEKATEVDHIFNLLNTEYASFLNYEIILTLAQKYGLIQDQTEMNYPQYLQDFINKHRVSEFLEINPTLFKFSDSSQKITLKIDVKPTCKLAKVKELSEAIADKMKWNPSAVRILDIGEGCITVTLIIPANLADYVFNRDTVFTEKQKEDLINLKVLSMKFNEKIYHLGHMQEDQDTTPHHGTPPPSSTHPHHEVPPPSSMPPHDMLFMSPHDKPSHDMSSHDMPHNMASHEMPSHDMPSHDTSSHDMPHNMVSHEMPSHDMPSHDMPPHDMSSHNMPSMPPHDMSSHNMRPHDMSLHEKPSHDMPPHDMSLHEKPSHDMPPHNMPSHDMHPHDMSSHDMPPHDMPSHDMPPHDMSLHEKPSHDMPPHDMLSHDMHPHDMSSHDMPPHDMPSHDMHLHDMSSHDMPSHDMPLHDMPPKSLHDKPPHEHDKPLHDLPPKSSHDVPPHDMPPQDTSSTPLDHDTHPPSSATPTNKSGTDLQWTNCYQRTAFQVDSIRDVLIIVSEDVTGPDVVQRRPAIQLTEEWREKLENQGVSREHQFDDLTIVKARYCLDKRCTLTGVETSSHGEGKLTRERVLKQIQSHMKKCEPKKEVILHYIGAGKRNTGDWCFEDGFITFRDLAKLYLKFSHGHVRIVTDCSHSGSWVRECMTFLDEQGVKPCGHSARDKGILISVFASCLSHQVPRQLAYSLKCCENDKITGDSTFKLYSFITLESKIADSQHTRGINFTEIQCGNDANPEECLCLPQATWQEWNAAIFKTHGKSKGRKAWYMLRLVDDDETILGYTERTQGEEAGKHTTNCGDYGIILQSGWGKDVPENIYEAVMETYRVYKKKSHNLA